MKRINVKTNVVVNIIRTIAITILSFITFPFVCRILGDENLGQYTWVTSFIYYFTVLAHISLPNVAMRLVVKYKDDPEEMSLRIQEIFIIQAITTLIAFLLMVCIVGTVYPFNKGVFDINLISIVSVNFLISAFSFEWLYIALEKHVYMAIRSILILAVIDILIFLFVKHEDIYLYAFLTIATNVIIVLSDLICLRKIFRYMKKRPYNFKQYKKLLLILITMTVATALYEKTDQFILGLISDSKKHVGSYAVGIKGVEIIVKIILSLTNVFIPRASDYYEHKDERQFININKYAVNIAFFIVIPAIATMASLASPITFLIAGSKGYKDADWVLITLSSIMLTKSLINMIYTQILVPMKKEKYYAISVLVSAILNIGLSLLFGLWILKDHPAVGVALGTSISDIVSLIILIIVTKDKIRPIIFNFNNLKIVFLGGIIALFSLFIGEPLAHYLTITFTLESEIATALAIIITVFLSAIIYFTGLIITKEKLTTRYLKLHHLKK